MKKMLSILATVALCESLSACMATVETVGSDVKPETVIANPTSSVQPDVVDLHTDNTAITLEQIMADPQWIGNMPIRPAGALIVRKSFMSSAKKGVIFTMFTRHR